MPVETRAFPWAKIETSSHEAKSSPADPKLARLGVVAELSTLTNDKDMYGLVNVFLNQIETIVCELCDVIIWKACQLSRLSASLIH